MTTATQPVVMGSLAPADRFELAPHVRVGTDGDELVLMHLRHHQFYQFKNAVTADVWTLLLERRSVAEIIDRLVNEYEAPPEQLTADVEHFLANMLEQGFIQRGSAAVQRPPIVPTRAQGVRTRNGGQAAAGRIPSRLALPPSTLRCGLLLCSVRLALKTAGFERTLRWVRARAERVPLAANVDLVVVRATEYQVALAAALFPGRALCLEQSTTLWYLLRRGGIAAEFRMGAKPYPFETHAWVEVGGQVVNDFDEHVKHFIPIANPLPEATP